MEISLSPKRGRMIFKMTSVLLVCAMVLTNAPALAAHTFRDVADSDTQTSSPVETVYVNSYSGTDRAINFNEHWKFYLGDAVGGEAPAFNDASWEDINVPHDYSIDQDYTASGEAESGFLPGGTGWYRKSFTVASEWEGKRLSINFDGVYMNASVYLNGEKLGSHPYGYTDFSFELPADKLNYDIDNVLAVKVEHKMPSSRWYSGSGIYRDVTLVVTDPVHVARHGTKVTTPDIASGDGTVQVAATVANDSSNDVSVQLRHSIMRKGTEAVEAVETFTAVNISSGGSETIDGKLTVSEPLLWGINQGNLYTVRTEVLVNGQTVDTYDTDFGFRWFKFDSQTGFSLNGENVKLKGVCMHHDQGALGSEAWHRSVERQVELLQEMGCNAIRVSHNPASQILIDMCNEKGILVVDEAFDTWEAPKGGNVEDFSRWFRTKIGSDNTIEGGSPDMVWAEFDVQAMVRRGINAPSIIMWSVGNEVFNGSGGGHKDGYGEVAVELINWVQEVDTTRPTTTGDERLKKAFDESDSIKKASVAIARALHAAEGVVGFNYASIGQMSNPKAADWRIYGSETASSIRSRGVYNYKGTGEQSPDQRLTAYDRSHVGWGLTSSESWWNVITFDRNAGEFVWTGFDYLGEPTPWNSGAPGSTTPNFENAPKSSYFGIIETTGFAKDAYYFYQSQWSDQVNTLHILPTWNEEDILKDENGNVEVVVYSDAAAVELFLNGESLGKQEFETKTTAAGYTYQTVKGKAGHTALYMTWWVPYQAGELRAVAYDKNGAVIQDTQGRSAVKTTDVPSKLHVYADRDELTADGKDLCYVTIDVTDAAGNFVNGAEPNISVSVQGEGVLLALDNGAQADHTPYSSSERDAFNGKLLAIVQSTKQGGEFTITATADGLEAGTATIKTTSVQDGGGAEQQMISMEYSRNYYVLVGSVPVLPESVLVHYSDGTEEKKKVVWEQIENDLISSPGSFTVMGAVDGITVKAKLNITMLEQMAALLNYSTAIVTGTAPNLPATRPAVTAEGEILNVQFPVTWEAVDSEKFETPGLLSINGSAKVFGKNLPVTATVRVSDGAMILGENMAGIADFIYLNGVETSDLDIIRDDKTAADTAVWTGAGEIVFWYNTVSNFTKVDLHLKDTAPISSTMHLEWSADGTVWKDVEAEVSNQRGEGKTIRTFSFDGVPALQIKLVFDAPVSLIEAELYIGTPSFPVGQESTLKSLMLNGQYVDQASLQAGVYKTSQHTVENIVAVGVDNASVTILPAFDEVVRIFIESEDHTVRSEYQIHLNQQDEEVTAEDDKHDYDPSGIIVFAPSEETEKAQNGAVKTLDGNTGTIWHTAWDESLASSPERRYIQFQLAAPAEIFALRYLPQQINGGGQSNGLVSKYRVDVSMTGDEWETVVSGDWEKNSDWKIAEFDKAVRALYVRLYGVETVKQRGGGLNENMSAAEVRICVQRTDLYGAAEIGLQESYPFENKPVTPEPVVTMPQGKETVTLVRDTDYTATYLDNDRPGTGIVLITGIGAYKGVISKTFTIKAQENIIERFEDIHLYTQLGALPILPGTVTAYMSSGDTCEMEVSWDSIDPADYARYGEFDVQGTVPGETLRPVSHVMVRGAVAVENISAVTPRGCTPKLPESVTVYWSDGEETTAGVTWELEGVSFDQELDYVVSVSGAVSGFELEASASVRIGEGTDRTNIALATGDTLPLAISSYCSNGDRVKYINDGEKTFYTGDSKKIWCDWESKGGHPAFHSAPWVGIVLGEESATVGKISIGFIDETESKANEKNKVLLPTDYTVQYYVGSILDYKAGEKEAGNGANWEHLGNDENWIDADVISQTPIPASDEFAQMLDVTFEPIETTAIRVIITPQEENWVGVDELEVFVPQAAAHSDFEVTSIQVGGEEKLGDFSDKDLTVDLGTDSELPEIIAMATNNAAITVIPANGPSGAAKIIFTSEDGTKTETYTIQFVEPEPEPRTVISVEELAGKTVAPGTTVEELNLPETVSVTLSDGSAASDVGVVWNTEAYLADVVGTYDLTGELTMPDETVTNPEGLTAAVKITVESVEPGLDKAPIDNAIAEAEAAKAGITVNDGNPSDVTSGTKFVTTEVMKALDDAIQAAKAAKETVTTEQDVTDAAKALTDAAAFFTNAIQTGSYVPSYMPPSNTTTKTEKNEDGSTTKTVTNKTTGTVTETTTWPNGDKTVVVTKKDGTVTTTATNKDGLKTETVTTPDGETTAEVTLPKDTESAQVTIPVEDPGPGTVAVIVREDGTEEVIKTSVATEDGIRFTANESVAVKLIDNSKHFDDVADTHWAAGAVQFVASRELFDGTGKERFSPMMDMSRAMLVTVLARLDGVDTTGGETWYSKAMDWGMESGITDGTNANASITRESLVVMLYRYAGEPTSEGEVKIFTDSDSISGWAVDAMDWAIKTGIINGKNGNILAPQGTATRAEVAAMLMRFVAAVQ